MNGDSRRQRLTACLAEGDARQWPRCRVREGDGESVTLVLFIPAGLHWFEGHFPGQAVLPGVVQSHWACLLGQQWFAITAPFSGLDNLKFQRMILPATELTLQLRHDAARGTLDFHYSHAGELYSSGRARFAAVG